MNDVLCFNRKLQTQMGTVFLLDTPNAPENKNKISPDIFLVIHQWAPIKNVRITETF